MNYLRLLLFFIPIGASFDFTYASFGGVIVSQLLYIMFSVSSSGFVRNRDSLVYPLCDFLFMLLQLCTSLSYLSSYRRWFGRKCHAFWGQYYCLKSILQFSLNDLRPFDWLFGSWYLKKNKRFVWKKWKGRRWNRG